MNIIIKLKSGQIFKFTNCNFMNWDELACACRNREVISMGNVLIDFSEILYVAEESEYRKAECIPDLSFFRGCPSPSLGDPEKAEV